MNRRRALAPGLGHVLPEVRGDEASRLPGVVGAACGEGVWREAWEAQASPPSLGETARWRGMRVWASERFVRAVMARKARWSKGAALSRSFFEWERASTVPTGVIRAQ